MKTSAIVCAVLAGTFGLTSVASAQMLGHWPNGDRIGQRDGHDAQRDNRQADRRDSRRAERQPERQPERQADRRDDRRDNRQQWRSGYQQPNYQQRGHYSYQQPAYRVGPRFSRGGYLPYEYRQQPYYVSNWQAYPTLYAPPYGHQWLNVDGEFLLVALATGLIANALLN
jgi:Ni/Co efflux regulator RcnB